MFSVLISKIITYFVIMVAGFTLVKTKIVKPQDIHGIARITLYLFIPCIILRAFCVEFTPALRNGMIFSFVMAIAIHLFFFMLLPLMRKVLHFNEVEQLSVIYPNSANLAIPLIAATMGWDYVIYASSYLLVQLFFIWSHGRMVMQGERGAEWKKMFLNINVLSAVAGLVLLLLQYRFPKPIEDAIFSMADMVGPITLLICGILLASTKLSMLTTYRRWWMVVLLRLVVLPLVLAVIFKYSGLAGMVKDGAMILLVTLFAVVMPPATTLTLMAEVYEKDAFYANLLNVVSTLFFLITLPLVIGFYMQ